MRLLSGKRIGQSGSELTIAVVFSGIIHILIVFAAVSLYVVHPPRVLVPPYYQVKLVGLPADISPVSPVETAASPPKEEARPKTPPSPKVKKSASRPMKAAPKTGALPEFSSQKPKTEKVQPQSAETMEAQPQPAAKASAEKAAPSSGGGAANVSVTTPQQEQDPKLSWYLKLVREKIGQYWQPPIDAKDAKARVIFTINRSGWVGDVNLDEEHSLGAYGFRASAIRAIRASNPLPPLPDEFPKQTLELSVDLMAEQ